jgi:hypothetical protein
MDPYRRTDHAPRTRLVVGLLTVLAAGTACGGAASTSSAPVTVPKTTTQKVVCPQIVCSPGHDYGQPTVTALQDAEKRIAASGVTFGTVTTTGTPGSVSVSGSVSGSGSSAGSAPGSGSVTVTGSVTPTAVVGPAGPAGPAGPRGATGPAGPPSPNFGGVYQKFQKSIAQFETHDCSDGQDYAGSGFLIAPQYVATAAHVVHDQQVTKLRLGGQIVTGRTVGIDRALDVALVRLSKPVSNPVVPLATTWPAVGSQLAVMGYALGGPLSMQQGHVSAIRIIFNGTPGFLVADTAEDHGSSGGAVLDPQGRAVAVVSASLGEAGLVKVHPGSIAAGQKFATWKAHPQSLPQACPAP